MPAFRSNARARGVQLWAGSSNAPERTSCRVLKQWRAVPLIAVQRSTGPHGSCVQRKSPLGFGGVTISMNIIGIGMDATEIDRIAAATARFGERFLRRVFTDGEIAYAQRRRNPAPHLARPLCGK